MWIALKKFLLPKISVCRFFEIIRLKKILILLIKVFFNVNKHNLKKKSPELQKTDMISNCIIINNKSNFLLTESTQLQFASRLNSIVTAEQTRVFNMGIVE